MLYHGKLQYAELYDDSTYPYTDVKAVWEANRDKHPGKLIVTNAHWHDAGPAYCGNYKVGGKVLSNQYPDGVPGFGWSGGELPEMRWYMGGVENFISTIPALMDGKRRSLDYGAGVERATERTWFGRDNNGEWYVEVTTEAYTLDGIVERMEALGIVDGMVLDGSGSSQWYDGETRIPGDGRRVYSFLLLWFEDKKEGDKLNIIETDLKWAYPLTTRYRTDYIVLHHEAGTGSVEQVHQYHLSKGWAGIAYHYFVRLDGSIYRGRPENTVGGHTSGYNDRSIGICAEGNFEKQTMPDVQREALRALVQDVRSRYPDAQVVRHSDLGATACPGKNYPFDYITEEDDNVNNPIYKNRDEIEVQAPWGLETFNKLVDKGYLKGESDGVYNISRDMLRILVILDRAGQFD